MMNIELATLHAAQQAIVDSPARFKVMACGRRFGKTLVAVDMLTNRLLDGERVAYFAPTYRMGADVWRELKQTLRPLARTVTEHEWRMELYTGGVLECWSLANQAAETVRGRQYQFVVMDEAALFDSAAAWHGAIRPLLTDSAGGALFASPPRGRNWFWHLYLQGQDPNEPDWASWSLPTAANPYIRKREIEAARMGMPERVFRQEYEAEFLDDGGVVFRNIGAVCVGEPMLKRAGAVVDRNERYVFGVDWGKDNDFTCISVMTKTGKQVHLERFNQIGWTVQRGRLAALCDIFQPRAILAEENSVGSVNIDALRREGLPVTPFTTTFKSKGPLIEELVLALERQEVTLLNDGTLKHELMAYEMSRTTLGWTYGAPSGGHDDTVMATALSLWASRRYGGELILWA